MNVLHTNRQAPPRVLIVEDDFLVSEIIEAATVELGFPVVGKAADGRQALEMTESMQPDAILMDIMMPDMDGIEATRRIQESFPTPVIVLTAYERPELVRQCSAAGAGAYVVKPPKAAELERAILIAIARFQDMMELRQLSGSLQTRNQELEAALAQVKLLSGLLPICAACKRIRDRSGDWNSVEKYVSKHSEAQFTHGICPTCAKDLYKDFL